jgi:hypothetical protein
MSDAAPGAGGFLEFFILEASDYVEQLDGLLVGAGRNPSGPDTDAMQRVARALRGTATMAKIPTFADLASGFERVGRALQDGALSWEPGLSGALVAAVDDFKILLRAARSWSPSEDQRASTRAAELSRYAPARTPAASPASSAQPSAAPASSFLGTEAANIAAGLELLTTRAGDSDTAANVLRRVRALRGVAGVKEIGPLADVLEATENASRGLESGDEPLSGEGRQLLEAAAAYLRTLSAALRGDGDVNAPSSARDAFASALETWSGHSSERERVVPISDLFYADGAPGLVEASQNPPTTVADRFRLELVSLGEHLRQVVDAARKAGDSAASVRARRDLRHALRALQAAAQSFGETEVAEFIGGHLDSADHLDFLGLAALDDLAGTLAEPGAQGERLRARLRDIAGGRDLTSAIGAGFGEAEPNVEPPPQPPVARATSPLSIPTPPIAAQPVQPIAPPPAPRPAPVPASSNIADMLDSSIAALDTLATRPLVEPTPLPEEELVPIESLTYRGRAALDRAVEIRDAIKRSGSYDDRGAIDELFDLLELARAE